MRAHTRHAHSAALARAICRSQIARYKQALLGIFQRSGGHVQQQQQQHYIYSYSLPTLKIKRLHHEHSVYTCCIYTMPQQSAVSRTCLVLARVLYYTREDANALFSCATANERARGTGRCAENIFRVYILGVGEREREEDNLPIPECEGGPAAAALREKESERSRAKIHLPALVYAFRRDAARKIGRMATRGLLWRASLAAREASRRNLFEFYADRLSFVIRYLRASWLAVRSLFSFLFFFSYISRCRA